MNRITYIVLKNFLRVPFWFFNISKMGKLKDKHTEEERYCYLRDIIKNVNKTGNVKVKVDGIHNLPKENGFIMFPNHQGLFDVLAIIESSPRPFSVVVKKEMAGTILVKQVVELLKGMFIDREDIRSSMKIITKMTDEVKKGRNYVIFPEGTRSKNENNISSFKGGTFKSAVNAKCPIVPVALIDCFKPFDIKSLKEVNVQVIFLPPIYPEQYIGKKTVEIADIVHDKIQDEINKKLG